MSGNSVAISYEEPCPEEFVKEELILYDYGNEGDISTYQPVNEVDLLPVKKEHEGEPSASKAIDEEDDCEVKPFGVIFCNEEEDIGVSDSYDCDPLAIEQEDGIENAVGFEIKEKDDALADNGEAVSQIPKGNAYPSCSKNGSHLKSREESIACESSNKNKHHDLTSDAMIVPEIQVNGNCQFQSICESNPKKHTTSDKLFQCPHCEFRCSIKRTLNHHLQDHFGVKPFQCSYCEFRCFIKGNLKSHMLTHTGDKPLQCSYCEYRCIRKSCLKRHIMVRHTDNKQFQCSYCEYRCSENGTLKRHMLTHTGDKPFQCSFCGYRCSQKGRLKKHMLTHTDDKPF